MMNRSELERVLEELLRRGLVHRAWELTRALIEGPGSASLRRRLKYGFLRTDLVPRLPASFWNEPREAEARRLGVKPIRPSSRVGEMAFPVVFPSQHHDCFVVARVRALDADQDELPSEDEVHPETRQAMATALDAARSLTGDPRRFRVSLDKSFPEKLQGTSCGLAVALAALSCMDERGLVYLLDRQQGLDIVEILHG